MSALTDKQYESILNKMTRYNRELSTFIMHRFDNGTFAMTLDDKGYMSVVFPDKFLDIAKRAVKNLGAKLIEDQRLANVYSLADHGLLSFQFGETKRLDIGSVQQVVIDGYENDPMYKFGINRRYINKLPKNNKISYKILPSRWYLYVFKETEILGVIALVRLSGDVW